MLDDRVTNKSDIKGPGTDCSKTGWMWEGNGNIRGDDESMMSPPELHRRLGKSWNIIVSSDLLDIERQTQHHPHSPTSHHQTCNSPPSSPFASPPWPSLSPTPVVGRTHHATPVSTAVLNAALRTFSVLPTWTALLVSL